MAAKGVYFDISYLARLYLRDEFSDIVLEVAKAAGSISCAWHGRVELVATLHRAFREGRLEATQLPHLLDQFAMESQAGVIQWLEPSSALIARIDEFYRSAGRDVFLRSADALHLATATLAGFTAIYTHNRQMLKSAPLFGLQAMDFIS